MQLQYAFLPLKNQSFETYVLAYQDRVKTGVQAFNTYNNTGQLESNDDAYALALFNDDFKFHQHLSEMSDFRFFPSVYSKDTTTDWNNTGSELLQLIDTNYTLHPLMIFYAKLLMRTKISLCYVLMMPSTPSCHTNNRMRPHFNDVSILNICLIQSSPLGLL